MVVHDRVNALDHVIRGEELGVPRIIQITKNLAGVFVLGAVFSMGLAAPSSAGAPKPYNSAQLKYLFAGSEFEASTGGCSGKGQPFVGEAISRFNFAVEGTLDFEAECVLTGTEFQFEEGQVSWEIKDGEICFSTSQIFDYAEVLNNNNCWIITPWKWRFAALDYKGNEVWTMTLEFHPKHSSWEELQAALKGIRKETEIAKT